MSLVRLTDAERRQVAVNARDAAMPIAAFVRARILPQVDGSEVLKDPIPGGRRTAKRSALTVALQRIAVNLAQLDSFIAEHGDHDLEEEFGALRLRVRGVQSAHLSGGAGAVDARSGWTDELNELGKQLNRVARGANARNGIARPANLAHLVATIAATVERMEAGQGASDS